MFVGFSGRDGRERGEVNIIIITFVRNSCSNFVEILNQRSKRVVRQRVVETMGGCDRKKSTVVGRFELHYENHALELFSESFLFFFKFGNLSLFTFN